MSTPRRALRLLGVPLLLAVGCGQEQEPAVEDRGPILGMHTAAGFDEQGCLERAGVAFTPDTPRLVVVVAVGDLADAGQAAALPSAWGWATPAFAARPEALEIAWSYLTLDGEQPLFSHRINVGSSTRIWSAAKSRGLDHAECKSLPSTECERPPDAPL